jgi:hypothetical protein
MPRPLTGTTSEARDGSVLRAALEYAGLGLRVVRLNERSKRPNIPDWPNTGATIDPTVIRRWFEEQPDANLGIVGGRGLAVLDVDTDKDGVDSLCRLVAEHSENGRFPATAVAYTGSGGFHVYFRVPPDDTVGSPIGFLPGLDVRGTGGQVVAPPSIHPETGKPYLWIWHPRDGIALMPKWLLALLAVPAESTDKLADSGRERAGRKRPKARKARKRPQERSAGPVDRLDIQARNRASEGLPGACPTVSADPGELIALTEEVIARFPVPDVGQRHRLMVPAVGSLVGRGFDDETVTGVMMRWYDHFRSLGSIGSARDEMEQELAACIAATRDNPAFRTAPTQSDYEAACAAFVLPQDVLDLLSAPIAELGVDDEVSGKGSPGIPDESTDGADRRKMENPKDPGSCYLGEDAPLHNYNTLYWGNTNERSPMRVTRGSEPNVTREMGTGSAPDRTEKRPLVGSLCESRDERWFVESLLVMWALQRRRESRTADTQGAPRFQMTHDQLIRVVAARFPEATHPVWQNSQFDRLKRKYINRLKADGRRDPATRFELFREVAKGQPNRGAVKGTPSTYEPTGIEFLLRPKPRSQTALTDSAVPRDPDHAA